MRESSIAIILEISLSFLNYIGSSRYQHVKMTFTLYYTDRIKPCVYILSPLPFSILLYFFIVLQLKQYIFGDVFFHALSSFMACSG